MNVVALSGRASKDIEMRLTPNGKAVANGTIAVQRKFKNQNGEYEADFHDFVVWGRPAEILAEYVKKGDKFGISGELQNRYWKKDDGTNVKITEVNVSGFDLPVKSKNSNQSNNQNSPNTNDPFSGEGSEVNDDDLPF